MVRALAMCLALAAGAAGCVTRAPLAEQYDGPRELPATLAERYTYEPASLPGESDRLRERRSFVVREISLPATGSVDDSSGEAAQGEPIEFEYYDIEGNGTTPVVVLLPILNGNLWISRYFARYFTDQGWAAVVVDRERDPLEVALEHPEEVIRQNITDYRRVLDWVEENPQLDSTGIGVFGISFGGMDAVMLAALDERVGAVVAAMAGGDLAKLLMNTSYRGIARQVHRMLRETGISREVMEERIDDLIDTDPMALAPYVDAEDVLLVMTRTDLIIPFESQQALRKSLGEPEALYLPTGHRTSVFYFPLLRSSAYDFFARQFDVPQ